MALTVKRVQRTWSPGRYGDGGGLYLQVKRGRRSWVFRYEIDGRERWMGLGPVADVALDDARDLARQARGLLRQGVDPLEARRTERARRAAEAAVAAAKSVSFEEVAREFHSAHAARWRNRKHRAQFLTTLERYVFPIFGVVPVGEVDATLILRALTPIWSKRPETAGRIRGRVERVLDYATVRGLREGENPARWRGWLAHRLPPVGQIKRVEHHAALPYADVPAFFSALTKRPAVAARALEFTILTAGRTGEVVGARWSEVDFAAKVWTIPGERMKGRREHRVPLSDRAIAILRALPREADFVFPGPRKGEPISSMSMLMLLRRMGRQDTTVHGFRSSFRDWVAEMTTVPNHVAEAALAHVVGNRVEAAYRRSDLLALRRSLMTDWARYCCEPAGAERKVVSIRRRSTKHA